MDKRINILFWIFWAISLVLSLIESFTYSGYLLGRFGIGINVIMIIAGILAAIVLLLRLIKKDTKPRKSDRIVYIFFAFILTFYVVLKVINRLTPVNFVFSKIHVQPDNLLWTMLISALPAVIAWVPKINFRKLFKIQSFIFLFVAFIILRNLYSIYKSEWANFNYIVSHPNASYGDKMRMELCPIFYNYTLFINKYTPENASLLMPPQSFPWPYSGNGGMLRYFVYPRNIINGKEYEPPSKDDLKNIDYVLLNWGETEQTQGVYTHEWPKFDVNAEKIVFMNEDGSYGGEVKGNYLYKDYKGKRVWGLIVVKH
jgi:hypothetical protein